MSIIEEQRAEAKAAMEATTSPGAHLHGGGGDEQLGQSSREYCPASGGRVPFGWEDEPGKPKSPPWLDDAVPPLLCPSPAMQSARLAGQHVGVGGRTGRKLGMEPEFEGCLPVKLHLGRAMKRWHLICFFSRGQ